MKRSILGLTLILLTAIPLTADTITVRSSGNTVISYGGYGQVPISISGLADSQAPSLGAFELDITFDPLIFELSGVTFGDPIKGDQLDHFGLGSITDVTPGLGTVNVFELSLDSEDDLNNLQLDRFMLFTLTFHAAGIGASPLGISISTLSDASGAALYAQANSGKITSVPVPEPSTLLLAGVGLSIVAAYGRKKQRMQ